MTTEFFSEKTVVNLVAEKLNKYVEFVLDPTLLLSKEDYMELFVGKNLPDNKGIYTYILDDSDWKTQVVETAKETLGLPQFSNQHNKHTVNSEKKTQHRKLDKRLCRCRLRHYRLIPRHSVLNHL